ncbi:hypothetical protein COTS27_00991 [Spirochaetota bacterium]|nr:hypothetical protein COTS27_00991 [Spirochaetota bacterium]
MIIVHKILGFERSKTRFNPVNTPSGNEHVEGIVQELTIAATPQFSCKLRGNNKGLSLLTHLILMFCCFFSISLSSCAPLSGSASSPATNNPPPRNYTSPVEPVHLSSTFNGTAVAITTEVTVSETSAVITIMGIENIEGTSADSGMLTIAATGYTVNKTTLTIPNPEGTNATNVVIGDIIVTANDQAVTHRVTVNFLALSSVSVTLTDAKLENSLMLSDTDRTSETGITIKQCEQFDLRSALNVAANGSPVSDNAITLDPERIANVYYDRTVDSTNNMNNQRISVTVAGTSYEFMFPVIIQECTAAGLTQIEDSSLTPSAMAWNIDNDLRLNLIAELINVTGSEYADDNYMLTADIDLGNANAPWSETVSMMTGGKGFTPIGTTIEVTTTSPNNHTNRFRGNFNCNNKTIANLYINNTVVNETNNGFGEGLFGAVETSGVIKNCALIAVKISGNTHIGGLVGLLDNGTILHSYTSGSILTGVSVGGLVGIIQRGSIMSSYSSMSITGITFLGGLVGQIPTRNGSVTNSYATGTVTSTDLLASNGGLIGTLAFGGVTNSYSTGHPVGPGSDIGGFVGKFTPGNVVASYWDINTSTRTRGHAGTGRMTAQMQVAAPVTTGLNEVYVGWDSNVWKFATGKYPRLINVACANRQDNPDATECTSTLE